MQINFYLNPEETNWPFSTVQHGVLKYCIDKFPDINFVVKNAKDSMFDYCLAPACKYAPTFLVMENDANKKYILISFWDKLRDVIEHHQGTAWDIENCVEILTSCGVHTNDVCYKDAGYVYTPAAYPVTSTQIHDEITRLSNIPITKTVLSKPMFRGRLYEFREYLYKYDDRFDIFDRDTDGLKPISYINELNHHMICLHLNGAAEITHRDIEIMGVGGALLRQKMVVKFHNELIPNYHYIAVEYDDMEDPHRDESSMLSYYKELSDRFIDRYYEAAKDEEFMRFVAENGHRWYLENGTTDKVISIFGGLIDFTKLL